MSGKCQCGKRWDGPFWVLFVIIVIGFLMGAFGWPALYYYRAETMQNDVAMARVAAAEARERAARTHNVLNQMYTMVEQSGDQALLNQINQIVTKRP